MNVFVRVRLEESGSLDHRQHRLRVILAGAIGNLLEWYDFGLYGLLAPELASLFFPAHDRMAALLGVYGGFAAGFAVRPIGALALGRLADRAGRRFVLMISVALMGVATVAVGLLPTYAAIGLWAPGLLILVRVFQGFSVGGEFVDSVTYLVEVVPQSRRGITASVANLGSTAGMLLAAAVAAALTSWAGPARLGAWAWRMPCLLGGVVASAAYYFRRHLPESPRLPPIDDRSCQSPLGLAIREEPGVMLACVLFTSGYGIVNYVVMVFLPTYAHEFGHIAEQRALGINTAAQALALLVVPLSGWASDRLFTRRAMLAGAFAGEAVVAWKAFELAGHNGVGGLWLAQLALAALLAVVMGVAPSALAEQFRHRYRVTAHAVTFNIGIGLAGGTAPMVATALIKGVSNPMAAAGYLIFGAALSAGSALALHERSREPLG
ncbi:MAG: MFS transporter [Acidobacteriia bacterium]|nr:MFS transporter [Terriglobia bacterium]